MRFVFPIFLLLQICYASRKTLGDSSDASDIHDCNKTFKYGSNLRNDVHKLNIKLQIVDDGTIPDPTPPPTDFPLSDLTPDPTPPPTDFPLSDLTPDPTPPPTDFPLSDLTPDPTPPPTDISSQPYCPPCVCSCQPSSEVQPTTNNITIYDQVCGEISSELKTIVHVSVGTFVLIVLSVFSIVILLCKSYYYDRR